MHQIEDPSAEPLLETDREPDPATVEPAVAEFAVLERDALGRCRRREETEAVRDERDLGGFDEGQFGVGSGQPAEPSRGEEVRNGLERDCRCDPSRVRLA